MKYHENALLAAAAFAAKSTAAHRWLCAPAARYACVASLTLTIDRKFFSALFFHLLHARLCCLSNKRTLKFTRLVHPFFVHLLRCLCVCVHYVRGLCQVFNSFRQKIYLQYVCAFDAVELLFHYYFLKPSTIVGPLGTFFFESLNCSED